MSDTKTLTTGRPPNLFIYGARVQFCERESRFRAWCPWLAFTFTISKLAFNSKEAFDLNSNVFRFIKERSYQASEELAKMFGEPEVLKGYGRRNATLNAIAPTTSSAFILGQVSQGISLYGQIST